MSGKIRGERDCSWGRAWTPIFGSSVGRERRAARPFSRCWRRFKKINNRQIGNECYNDIFSVYIANVPALGTLVAILLITGLGTCVFRRATKDRCLIYNR